MIAVLCASWIKNQPKSHINGISSEVIELQLFLECARPVVYLIQFVILSESWSFPSSPLRQRLWWKELRKSSCDCNCLSAIIQVVVVANAMIFYLCCKGGKLELRCSMVFTRLTQINMILWKKISCSVVHSRALQPIVAYWEHRFDYKVINLDWLGPSHV